MSTNENYANICKDRIIQQTLIRNQQQEPNESILKYEEKDKIVICDKCSLLKNLKDTAVNIYNTTLKNETSVKSDRNFCDLDILKNFYGVLEQQKHSHDCWKPNSETSVRSRNDRRNHKHMKRSGSQQIDIQSKHSSTASNLDPKPSRKSRSLGRSSEQISKDGILSNTSKEEILKWKKEIETLEIKRQIFTAVGQNKPKNFRSSRVKEKSSSKQQNQNIQDVNEKQLYLDFDDQTPEDRLILINDDDAKVKNRLSKKEVEELGKEIQVKSQRSSRKKRNNSPNLPIQNIEELPRIELDINLKGGSKFPVPDVLMNLTNATLRQNNLPKLLNSNGEDIAKDKKDTSLTRSKNPTTENEESLNNCNQIIEKPIKKDNNISSKEIINVFTKSFKTDKVSKANNRVVKTKSKRKHKENSNSKDDCKVRKHKSKDHAESSIAKICPRHSKSRRKDIETVQVDEEKNIIKAPLLFGADYLMNSQSLQRESEAVKKQNKEKLNSIIFSASQQDQEDVRMKDRKEISFSNLNLSPIVDHYAKNKAVIDTIFDKFKKKKVSPRSKKSDEFSLFSDVVTTKEKTIRRLRQDRAKHYFGSEPRNTRLINQTTNHLVSDENLVEVFTKVLNNDLIKSSVEGIEPPRKIVNKSFHHRKVNSGAVKNNSLLHMTFLEPVTFPELTEKQASSELSPIDDNVQVDDKIEALPNQNKEVLKLRTPNERKSKISVLYEHRSNSARRKELRNKICQNNQASKANVVSNNKFKPHQDDKAKLQTCNNPDLTRRVSFERNSTKWKMCSKCQGKRKMVTSYNSPILRKKTVELLSTTQHDKSISANIPEGDTNTNQETIKKRTKLTLKKSSKKMCTVDTQTDLIEFKDATTVNDVCQTTKVKNVTKQCSPIIVTVPGVHKSDTDVIKKTDAKKSKDLNPTTYQKLQSAVLSLFENAKSSYEDEIEAFTKAINKKDINVASKHPNSIETEEPKANHKPNTPPVRPKSPVKKVVRQISPTKQSVTKSIPQTRIDVYSARTKYNDRSGIPKLYKNTQDQGQELKTKVAALKKQDTLTPNSSGSKLIDMKVLQECIEDLILVLSGFKLKQPVVDLQQPKKDLEMHKRKDNDSKVIEDVGDFADRKLSLDSIKKREKRLKKKRQSINKVLSSTSVDSESKLNRNSSEIYLRYKTKSRQLRNSHRKKTRKSCQRQRGEENKLRSVFKNRNCYGSSSYTQITSSGSEFVNSQMGNEVLSNYLESLHGHGNMCLNQQQENCALNFSEPLDGDDSSNLLMEQTTNVANQAKLHVQQELLKKLPSINKKNLLQNPETSSTDYRNVMEQLVYMFSQKPLPQNKASLDCGNARNHGRSHSSSSFSADSLEQSYKFQEGKNMPPKNCDFFVYSTTIELDNEDMKKDLIQTKEAKKTRTFTTFKNQNKLSSNQIINNTTSKSSYNVVTHDSEYATSGKKTASLKNFFKKGTSLLDLFKQKLPNSSEDTSSRCETVSEVSSLNQMSDQNNEVIAGFAPGQYWFSICPQKKNSLETVHEGVQASPSTKETSTMRKWADIVLNQSNQTKTSCQSNQSCQEQKCDYKECRKTTRDFITNDLNPNLIDEKQRHRKRLDPCGCPERLETEADLNKYRKPCNCKKVIDPVSLDVANFILNTLVNNVIDTIDDEKNKKPQMKPPESEQLNKTDPEGKTIHENRKKPPELGTEQMNGSVLEMETIDNKIKEELDDHAISEVFRNIDRPYSSLNKTGPEGKTIHENRKKPPEPDAEQMNGSVLKMETIGNKIKEELDDDAISEVFRNIDHPYSSFDEELNIIDDSQPREGVFHNELNQLLLSPKPPTFDDVDRILSNELSTMDNKEYTKRAKSKTKSVELIVPEKVQTPSVRSGDKNVMKTTMTIARSFSEKEIFEKMLNDYDKEDSIAERLSQDDQFFNQEIEIIKSNEEMEEVRSVSSKELVNRQLAAASPVITNITEPIDEPQKKNKKRKRFLKLFGKRKSDVMEIIPPPEVEVITPNQKLESAMQIIQEATRRRSLITENSKQGSSNMRSKSKDMRFQEETKRPLFSKKTTDCSPVEAEDIGICFARGFRPDNLSLSGDTCFNFNKQDKFLLSPNMNSNEESIIDFSERQTPLDYLLALGFMVDEASNALKDEDIRSRLLAAITEARVWINKITTTQGTLLYLVAYKTHPKTMRYFLQLVEAIINNRINNAIKLNGFLQVLERVEEGELQMIDLLGADKFEDEENEEKIIKKQLRQLFATVYKIANKQAKMVDKILTNDSLILLRVLAAKYRAGLHPHLELIASYIGQNLIKNEIQLEAAMIYLSRLDTAEVKLKEFEAYCAIRCDEDEDKNYKPIVE